MTRIPFEAVRAESLRQIETLCARLLPQGKRFGHWWKCRVPWRDDATASLMVSFTSGRWRDWGREGDNGTMIDLVMRLDNCTLMEAKDAVAALLGMSGDVEYKPTVQVKKKCKECRWLWRRYGPECKAHRYFCCRVIDFSFQEPVPLAYARHPRGECGTYGRLHEVAS